MLMRKARWLRSTALAGLIAFVGTVFGGEAVCPVIADNSIASFVGGGKYPAETRLNYGTSQQVKMKGRENQAIMKFDLSAIPKDASITKATLSVKLHDPEYNINQVGYSTVPVDWIEGKGNKDEAATHDFSCHLWAGPSTKPWGEKGWPILHIIHGNGGNVCGYTMAKKVGERWNIELPGRVFEAIRADQPGGLILMDETGLWGGKYANIFLMSREAGKDGPQLKVEWGDKDTKAPSSPEVKVAEADLDDGEMVVEITCGGDDGKDGMALGFDLRLLKGAKLTKDNWKDGKPVPRYRIPRPKAAGTKLKCWLVGLEAGAAYSVGVVAYDEGGNRSPVASTAPTKATGPTPAPRFGEKAVAVQSGGPLKVGDKLLLWASDELTKIEPVTGKTLEGTAYADNKARDGNTVWNGKDKKVVLHAARGEMISFRMAVERAAGPVNGIALKAQSLSQGDQSIPAKNVRFLREWYLKSGNDWFVSVLPELKGKNNGQFNIPTKDNNIADQKIQTIYVEIHVPKDAKPGAYSGAVEVTAAGKTGKLPIDLQVHKAVIPDEINFIIELNSYGARDKDKFFANHLLAHRWRLGYDALGYSHAGNVSTPFIPEITGEGENCRISDWSKWDEWMGPLLDGSLFKDMPRAGTPIPHYYLPFYENWPTSIYENYADPRFFLDRHLNPCEKYDYNKWKTFVAKNDVFVADGFSDKWKKAAVTVTKQFRKHCEEKGWTKTQLQIFCNNKHYGRKKAKRRNTSVWTLDEPSYARDFRALAFVYRTFHEPFKGTTLNVVTRGDVSRPQWQGDRLDGACDLSVVSGAFYGHQPLIQRRIQEHGDRYWFYGGSPGPNRDPTQIAAIYLKNWTLGCEGGLAYWTSFHGNDWDEVDALACVVASNHGYRGLAIPTDRIAAQRRIQQDIELFTLLSKRKGWSRRRVVRAVAAAINLASTTESKGADDPGRTSFKNIRAADLMKIRMAVLGLLDK